MPAGARRTVLVTPIAPARSGNGLAMRAGALLEALAAAGPVDLVVIPVSGPPSPLGWARAHARRILVADPPTGDAARRHLTAQLSDAELRAGLEATAPLPNRAALAPPTLAVDIAAELGRDDPPHAVVALRTYLAPVGIRLGRELGATRLVIDVDDDDEALLRSLGSDEDADAVGRLAAWWLPCADEVWLASPSEADTVRRRHALALVRVVPNTVRAPATIMARPGAAGLVFVGNLTYAPNADAARTLATEVLPLVREHHPAAHVVLVGAHDATLADLAVVDGVTLTGPVRELSASYAAADVAVIPLRHGAGTRIKVLEACAHGRPVVASTAALSGLDDLAERGVTVADGPQATADHVNALLDDPDLADRLADQAREAVSNRYSAAFIGSTIRRRALDEPDGEVVSFRLLWHDVDLDLADVHLRRAFAAIVPTADHTFGAEAHTRYGVEGRPGAYRVLEDGDFLATVGSAEEARDLVHLRLHRRVFERTSRQGWVRLHGALADLGDSRVLITGPSGSGKSTLAFRLLLDGHDVQGDESVLVRADDAVAVARPLHLKPGAEIALPELTVLRRSSSALRPLGDITVLTPQDIGRPWRIGLGPIDHLVVLGDKADPSGPAWADLTHTEVLPTLVAQLFPVTESKAGLLRSLTGALRGTRCHALHRSDPAAMSQTLIERLC